MARKTKKRKPQKIRYPIKIFCEGSQEDIYFNHLKNLINNSGKNKKIIDLDCNNRNGGAPDVIVKAAQRLCWPTHKSIAIFDHDLKDNEFKEALDYGRLNNVECGYSNLTELCSAMTK